MESKTVYCSLEPRMKIVKFQSQIEKPDKEILKNALLSTAAKDETLMATLTGKSIILQKMDPHIQDWCHIEDEDLIPDKSKVKVLLIQDLNNLQVIDMSNPIIWQGNENDIPLSSIPIIEHSKSIQNMNDSPQLYNDMVR